MKLLHSKSAAEPILAVTACPCANLFGLVTHSAVTVYRSTTLTTVFTFSLKPFQAPGSAAANAVRCCWSPSGRLFTLATATGRLLVLDVEGGSLVRLLEPATAATSTSAGASSSPAPSDALPAGVPRVQTTLPAGRPVLTMGWCAVPSLDAGRLNSMHAEVHTRCLPVRTGATAALLDEVVQGSSAALPSTSDAAGDAGAAYAVVGGGGGAGHHAGDSGSATASVSLLLVLGVDGVLRCLVGGLYEVHRVALSVPDPLCSPARGHRSGWEGIGVEDMHVRQCAVAHAADSERPAEAADWSWCFGTTAAEGVRPAVAQHHRLYLTTNTTTTTATTQPRASAVSWSLCEANLRDHLTVLATPRWLATCYVREYTRMALEDCVAAARDWHAVLRGRLWVHLDFPAAGPLITSAMLAQLTNPDPIALYKYARQQLQRAAVVEDLEVLTATLQRVVAEVTHVCYRCCEAALTYAAHLDALHDRHAAPLWQLLGDLRRELEAFVRRAGREAEAARDVALWVLQQSRHWGRGSRFAMGGIDVEGGSAARGRSPSPEPPSAVIDEAPLSATRQPALLQYLSALTHTSNTTAAGSMDLDEVMRLCAAVESCAAECTATSCSADGEAAAVTRLVDSAAAGDGTAMAAHAGAQLLSCVVTGVGDQIDGAEAASSASGASDDASAEDDSSANGCTTRGAAPCSADEDGAASSYHPHYEAGLEGVVMGDGTAAAAAADAALCCGVARGALATEKASLYTLRYTTDAVAPAEAAALMPTELTAYQLCVRRDASMAASVSVPEVCAVAAVDGSLITPRLKAVGTFHSTTTSTSSSSVGAAYVPTWYGYLEDDRHVLVCQPAAVGSSAASPAAAAVVAPFFVAVVDDEGRLVTVADEAADSEGSDGDGDAPSEEVQEGSVGGDAVRAAALCEVAGMEGVPLRVSMSRARSFCVVVGVAKYVVVSLYDDDY